MRPRVIVSVLAAAAFAIAMWWQGSKNILLEHVVADPKGSNALVTMTIHNNGERPDRLISVESSEAEARLSANPLPISAQHTSILGMDGAHIVLANVEGDLGAGRLIPLTLTFEHAGTITAKARIENAAMAHGGMGSASICRAKEGEVTPSLSIEVSPDNAGWSVAITTQDFEFSETLVNGAHVPGVGHAHLYVDGVKQGRIYKSEARITALPSGQHQVRVTLNCNDHRTYRIGDKPVTATVQIVAD